MSTDDTNLIVFLAGAVGGGCSLDSSPKSNWVEDGGGLPPYICKIAKAVQKSGKSKSSAIAIAVSRVKKWAAGADGVDADTTAKAATAAAEWEALKAKHKSKKLVKASRIDAPDYLMLSNVGSFNTDLVRTAWNNIRETARREARAKAKSEGTDYYATDIEAIVPYSYIRELWSDFIIVETEGSEKGVLSKVPYGVNNGKVYFGEAIPVKQEYVEVEDDLTDIEAALLGDVLTLSQDSALNRLIALAKK